MSLKYLATSPWFQSKALKFKINMLETIYINIPLGVLSFTPSQCLERKNKLTNIWLYRGCEFDDQQLLKFEFTTPENSHFQPQLWCFFFVNFSPRFQAFGIFQVPGRWFSRLFVFRRETSTTMEVWWLSAKNPKWKPTHSPVGKISKNTSPA